MSEDIDETTSTPPEFDFSAYPSNSVFHDRREGRDRRSRADRASSPLPLGREGEPRERRARKERRRRIDPTTFEKQYTDDELEFMNAMQRFKERTGKAFPSYAEVIRVAVSLGYRKEIGEIDPHDQETASLEF